MIKTLVYVVLILIDRVSVHLLLSKVVTCISPRLATTKSKPIVVE
jgi:hypothetical protein